MALTVDDIRAGIRARGFEADTDAQQLAFINQVQRRWFASNRWEIARVTATVAVTAGTSSYTLPAAAVHVSSIRLSNGNTYIPLEAAAREQVLEAAAANTTIRSNPYWWTLSDPGTVKLFPTPSTAGTLTVVYFRTCPILTAGSDVPLMPEAYVDILIAGSCELMAQRERQWDAARMFKDERKETERLARAQLGIVQQQTSDEVEQSGFYGAIGSY